MKVYVERGLKRTFVAAIDWPGWSRSGKDEVAALQALLDYGPRYQRVLAGTSVQFSPPLRLSELKVVEWHKGGTGTDFGAPQQPATIDAEDMGPAELRRSEEILRACWRQFEAAVKAGKGKALRTGPRGGGRTLAKMVEHVREAEEAYIERLGWWKFTGKGPDVQGKGLEQVQAAELEGLRASAKGKIPAVGPRGGKRWSARYFVRRAAWHILDHAWEIEDRLE